jgi:nucleotide sugar dehydrogenase
MKTILLVGYGTIGRILVEELEQLGQVYVYDPFTTEDAAVPMVTDLHSHYDFAFVCVPTEKREDGSADISIVERVIQDINADVIIVKSTVPVGTTDRLILTYRKPIVFSPEFTSATVHKGIQNFLVLGGERSLTDKVADLYKLYKSGDFRIIHTDCKTAEMSKYMLNCFLALKVTFCSEFAEACSLSGINYDDVRDIFISDSRINPSHTWVYKDKPYYDSHCFNKDIPAFVQQFNLPLMKSVDSINNNYKDRR